MLGAVEQRYPEVELKGRNFGAVVATGVALASLAACGSEHGEDESEGGADGHAALDAKFYDQLAVPRDKPDSISFARVEQLARPAIDGQRALLIFPSRTGSDTVYLCTRPRGVQPSDAMPCPYEEKTVIRVVESGDGTETVYALDRQDAQTRSKGGSQEGRDAITTALERAPMSETPDWFVQMATGG